jgi:hypothetical protein
VAVPALGSSQKAFAEVCVSEMRDCPLVLDVTPPVEELCDAAAVATAAKQAIAPAGTTP